MTSDFTSMVISRTTARLFTWYCLDELVQLSSRKADWMHKELQVSKKSGMYIFFCKLSWWMSGMTFGRQVYALTLSWTCPLESKETTEREQKEWGGSRCSLGNNTEKGREERSFVLEIQRQEISKRKNVKSSEKWMSGKLLGNLIKDWLDAEAIERLWENLNAQVMPLKWSELDCSVHCYIQWGSKVWDHNWGLKSNLKDLGFWNIKKALW